MTDCREDQQQGSRADEVRARLAELGIAESDVASAVEWVRGFDGDGGADAVSDCVGGGVWEGSAGDESLRRKPGGYNGVSRGIE